MPNEAENFTVKDVQELNNMRKLCENAVETLKDKVTHDSKVLLFVGNGITDKSLDTSNIVKNFIIEDFEEKDPVFSGNIKNLFGKFNNYLEEKAQDKTKYDMAEFLENFKEINKLKERFMVYLKKKCAKSRPNTKHFALLAFCSLIQQLPTTNSKDYIIPRIFTTNYDNLIEKVYIDSFRDEIIKREFPELIKHDIQAKKELLIPGYYLDLEEMDVRKQQNLLSIIPLHGSIRISRCIKCGQTLMSEGVALGKRVCIYCEETLEELIIPTEEESADTKLLSILNNEVEDKKTIAIIFIGYSFCDHHIMRGILHEIGKRKCTENGKIVLINYCNDSIDSIIKKSDESSKIRKNVDLLDILYDLPDSLEYTNSLFKLEKSPLSNMANKIVDKYHKKYAKNDKDSDVT